MAKYTLTFGMTTFTDDHQPITEIVICKDGKKTIIGYLSFFRKYRFQISKTMDGICDLGSTPVISDMAEAIKNMDEDTRVSFVKAQIIWAMSKYTNTSYAEKETEYQAINILPGISDELELDKIAAYNLAWINDDSASDHATYVSSKAELVKEEVDRKGLKPCSIF